VGVGIVNSKAVGIDEFRIKSGAFLKEQKLIEPYFLDPKIPKDKRAVLVGIDWIKTVPLENAFKEKGFFGNQNTVAQPVALKWTHTIERLKILFEIKDSSKR